MSNAKTRYVPSGCISYRKTALAEIYRKPDSLIAVAYVGKSSKPIWYINFRTEEAMEEKIKTLFDNCESWEKRKKENREKKKTELDGAKVGDLLSCSWGYDQTNVDFYQVIKKKGKTMTIKEIGGKHIESEGLSSMADYVSPVKDSFLKNGKTLIKRTFNMPFGILSITDENKKHYRSWYA